MRIDLYLVKRRASHWLRRHRSDNFINTEFFFCLGAVISSLKDMVKVAVDLCGERNLVE